MPSVITPSAVAVRAPTNVCVDQVGLRDATGMFAQGLPRVPEALGAVSARAALNRALRCMSAIFVGFGESFIVAFAFPLAILAIGIPIALLVRAVIWSVRLL
jgi:hypothetical protein